MSPTNQKDLFEVDVLLGMDEKPSFVSIVLLKVDFSVTVFLNEPEDDSVEVDIDDDIEILRIKFKSLDDATQYYNEIRNPFAINEIVKEYKSKEQ